jgi:ATP-dependent Clp protease ATP-binding subunit ClpC
MSFMFKRYPPPSRRAIFFAREAALAAGAAEIDSMHLLSGLVLEKPSRANGLLKLDERFPEEAARMRALKRATERKDIPLTRDSKRILVFAAEEANELDDYWIDTDHLVLGILRERHCAAAAKLEAVGLKIEEARKQVAASSEQREPYGAVPALWRLAKPISRVGHFAGIMYLLLIFVLIKLLAQRSC